MSNVVIIDYGMGNLHSVAKAFQSVADNSTHIHVSNDSQQILQADRVVVPGVGAIRDCVGEIRRLGFDEIISRVTETKPVLGICVGMQVLMDHSDENEGVDCLGLLKGEVKHFSGPPFEQQDNKLKVPHMGWNEVFQIRHHAMWQNIADMDRYYFVHSYYVLAADDKQVVGECDYGGRFTVAMAKENIFAVQFHPEKSQRPGLQLLKNFLTWDGSS